MDCSCGSPRACNSVYLCQANASYRFALWAEWVIGGRLPQNGTMIRRRVVVRGAVQGVFFRDTCRREAKRQNVSGWVANRDDGAVEAVFEGETSDVEAMVAWARNGPPQAVVGAVEVTEEAPTGEPGFRVVSGRR